MPAFRLPPATHGKTCSGDCLDLAISFEHSYCESSLIPEYVQAICCQQAVRSVQCTARGIPICLPMCLHTMVRMQVCIFGVKIHTDNWTVCQLSKTYRHRVLWLGQRDNLGDKGQCQVYPTDCQHCEQFPALFVLSVNCSFLLLFSKTQVETRSIRIMSFRHVLLELYLDAFPHNLLITI